MNWIRPGACVNSHHIRMKTGRRTRFTALANLRIPSSALPAAISRARLLLGENPSSAFHEIIGMRPSLAMLFSVVMSR